MRLIDADTAEKKLAELVELYEKRMPNWSPNDMLTSGRDAAFKWGFKADGAEKALEIIKDTPTVEAEPVKHGRWLSHFEYCKSHNYLPSGTSIPFWCSRCQSAAKEKTLYCPNCGAKMDLKDGESK